jgi:hypothetical protein
MSPLLKERIFTETFYMFTKKSLILICVIGFSAAIAEPSRPSVDLQNC